MTHSKSPGWEPGNHWVVCDVCGFDCRHDEVKERWDGLVVCSKDYETRHPQDFLRSFPDDSTAKGLVRPPTTDRFVNVGYVCTTNSAVANEAVAGCMVSGTAVNSLVALPTYDIPTGTFTNTL